MLWAAWITAARQPTTAVWAPCTAYAVSLRPHAYDALLHQQLTNILVCVTKHILYLIFSHAIVLDAYMCMNTAGGVM